MHAYLAKVLRSHDCETLVVGGTRDHVHSLFALSRKQAISVIVKEIKRTSSSWIKEVSAAYQKFHWQNGYGAFSVSQSHLDRVKALHREAGTASPAGDISGRVSKLSEEV